MGFFALVNYCSVRICGQCWYVLPEPYFVKLSMMVPLNSCDSCVVLGVIVLLLHSANAVDTNKLTHIPPGTLFPSYY